MIVFISFILLSAFPVTINAATDYSKSMPHATQYRHFPINGLECISENPVVSVNLEQMKDAAAEMYVKKQWNNWFKLNSLVTARKAWSPLVEEDRSNAVVFAVDYDPKGPVFEFRGGASHEITDPATGLVIKKLPCQQKNATITNPVLRKAGGTETPFICGVPRSADRGFGNAGYTAGFESGEVIEWIAINYDDSPEPFVVGLQIKYRNRKLMTHGATESKQIVKRFNLQRKERITAVAVSCSGSGDSRGIRSISITTNLGENTTGGRVNFNGIRLFKPRGKQVVSFKGYVDQGNRLKTLGLHWANDGYGKW